MDDGGFFEIDQDPERGTLVKLRLLPCAESRPVLRTNNLWGTVARYTVPCRHGDVDYIREWEPTGVRHHPPPPQTDADGAGVGSGDREEESRKNQAPVDPSGWRVRPLSRADDTIAWYNEGEDPFAGRQPFSDVHERRNDSESYNQ